MTASDGKRDRGALRSGGQAAEREARLAAALRENLQRRKAQTRSRRAGEADERPEGLPSAPDEAEDSNDP